MYCLCDTVKHFEIFPIGFPHRWIHSSYNFRRHEFQFYYLSIKKRGRMHNRFICDTHVSKERMGCQKVCSSLREDILSQSYSDLCLHGRYHVEKGNTFQFSSLPSYSFLEEIIIFLSVDHPKGITCLYSCKSVLFKQCEILAINLEIFSKEQAQYKNSETVFIFRIYLCLAFYLLKWLHSYCN